MVSDVARALERAGITYALGGSGLMRSLGLVEQVRDWDLTTDAPFEQVATALEGLPWERAPHGDGPYATAYRLAVGEVDLMGRFAIQTEAGIVRLPTVVCGQYEGLPVGSPEVWAVAYRLMERHPKADLLAGWLRQQGARADLVARLLQEPLPPQVRDEVRGWL